MPVEFVVGDIFESKCNILVNPVNCVGVMGAGLAYKFKVKFPEMFEDYEYLCDSGILKPGYPLLSVLPEHYKPAEFVFLFPTKQHWRDKSDLEMIEEGLLFMRSHIANINDRRDSLAIPALGCGLGALDWSDVKLAIVDIMDTLPNRVEVYEPISN